MTAQEQFEKEFQPTSLASASISHFLETGKVSGGLSIFLGNLEKDTYNAGMMVQRIILKDENAAIQKQNADLIETIKKNEETIRERDEEIAELKKNIHIAYMNGINDGIQ